MQIFCEYCGANVNVNKDMICPNCGATLYLDKEIRDYHSRKNRIDFERDKMRLQTQQAEYEASKIKLEKEKQRANTANKFYKFINLIRITGLIFFVFIIGAALFGIFGRSFETFNKETEPTETEYVEPFHTASLGDVVETRNYSICLEKYDDFDPNPHMRKDGYRYVKFYFKYTNLTDGSVYSNEEIYCFDLDGREYNKCIWLTTEDENSRFDAQTVMPNRSYSGWWYFEVPEETDTLLITFDEYVEFEVNIN